MTTFGRRNRRPKSRGNLHPAPTERRSQPRRTSTATPPMRAWAEKVADAAIAAAQDGRQRPEPDAGIETRGAGQGLPGGPHSRPEPEDMRPLGKTAGDIRMAWTLSRTAEELEEALAAKGITLAEVSAEEARQSERMAAFAKEAGNFARVLREGEIVAINAHGDVHRFDQRTTGDLRPEIEARLDGFAGIDRAGLLNVTDAKEAMQEASRAAYRDEGALLAEMDARPTDIERKIEDSLATTMTGTEFAAALDKAGITIARATAADVRRSKRCASRRVSTAPAASPTSRVTSRRCNLATSPP